MNNLEKKIQNIVNLYKLKRLSEAETLGKILIYSYPKVYFLHNLLGLIMYEQKKFIEAVNFYKSGLKIKPNYAMIYNNLGMLYKDTHNYIESEKNYKKYLNIIWSVELWNAVGLQ